MTLNYDSNTQCLHFTRFGKNIITLRFNYTLEYWQGFMVSDETWKIASTAYFMKQLGFMVETRDVAKGTLLLVTTK